MPVPNCMLQFIRAKKCSVVWKDTSLRHSLVYAFCVFQKQAGLVSSLNYVTLDTCI